jgi:Fe-S-cluster containining protein
MKESTTFAPILIGAGTRFTCEPCGFCCSFWDTHIDQKRKERLDEKDWVKKLSQNLQASGHQSMFKILGQSDQALIHREGGACGFLDSDLLCSVHSTEGFDAKPLVCQQYPNIYYETPRGLEVLLDYSCPEVIRNTGEAVTPEGVAKTLQQASVQKVDSSIPLNPKTNLDWGGYERLEEAFLEILGTSLRYEEKILQLNQLASALGQRLKKQPRAQRNDVDEALAAIQLTGMSDTVKQERPANPSRGNLYLAILVHWVESTFSREAVNRPMSSIEVLGNILRHWRNVGGYTFNVFKFRVNYGHVRCVTFNFDCAALRDPLDRYLYHQIRTLVGTGTIPIARRLTIIATNFALVKWFGRAYAASNGRSEVNLEDVVFAIKIVEKFLSNRLFNKLAEQRSMMSNYLNLLFDTPTLAVTMLSQP